MSKATTNKTRRRASKRRIPQAEGDLSGLLLLANAIGHVVQGSKNTVLRQEQRRIEMLLREWQEAYCALSTRYRDLRSAYENLSEQLERSESKRRRLMLQRLQRQGATLESSEDEAFGLEEFSKVAEPKS